MRFFIVIFSVIPFLTFSQNQLGITGVEERSKSFFIKVEANIVGNSGDKNPFAVFSELQSSAIYAPFKIGAEYRFGKLMALGLDASVNKWKASKGIIDEKTITEDQDYVALDSKLSLYIDEAFNWFENAYWLDLYLNTGLGYFKVSDGAFVGNLGIGTNIWVSKKVGLNLEGLAKFTLDSSPGKYDTSHFQYSMGVVFKLSNSEKKKLKYYSNQPDTNTNNTLTVASESNVAYIEQSETTQPDQQDNVNTEASHKKDLIDTATTVVSEEETERIVFNQEEANYIFNLSRKIKFNQGNYNFTQDSYDVLSRILKRLSKFPDLKFKIEGFADSVGGFADNEQLSKKRANAVKNYLVAGHVKPENLITIGKGELFPIASNLTKSGQSKNRRVEISKVD